MRLPPSIGWLYMLSQRACFLTPFRHHSTSSEALWLLLLAAPVTVDKQLSTRDLIKFLTQYAHQHKKLPGQVKAANDELQEPKRGIVIPADASTLPTAVAIAKARQSMSFPRN